MKKFFTKLVMIILVAIAITMIQKLLNVSPVVKHNNNCMKVVIAVKQKEENVWTKFSKKLLQLKFCQLIQMKLKMKNAKKKPSKWQEF